MVDRIGVTDPRVAQAMAQVPRHQFLDARWASEAYVDTPLPIGPEATVSAPHMVAIQLELARLREGHRVLEVGAGCGYLAALIAYLVGHSGSVFGIEFEEDLAQGAQARLSELGFERAQVRAGDGVEGWPEAAPFDRILVSYAVDPPLPSAWTAQLRDEGLLLVPLRGGQGTYLERYRHVRGRLAHDLRGPGCLFVGSKSPGRPPKV